MKRRWDLFICRFMAHKSRKTCRFSDIAGEPLRRLPPIWGFESEALVSFEEATKPLIGVVQEIEHMVYNIRQSKIQANNGLTIDESSSIALYSMEWNPEENSFYFILNETLRAPNRQTLLPPWFRFLRLFFTGLSKLPSANHRIIYRSVKMDLRDQYKEGECIVWWGFSSCTNLENEEFVGKSGTRTLFAIQSDTGKNIREHSFYPDEDEILLLPGREFEVVSSAYMGNKLTMIHLKEVQPPFPNVASLPPSNPPVSTSTGSVASGITATIKATPSAVQPKPTTQPKPIIHPVEVSYLWKKLIDNDIPGVIKEALQQQQCTILNLHYNNITDEGAALLSKALKHNEVRDSLNISTIGERKQNWEDRIRSVNTDRTSICLSELIVLSFAMKMRLITFSSNNFSLSCSSEINPRRSLSEDKFCLISSSRRIFSFSNRKNSLHSHVEHSILKAHQTSDFFPHRMKKKIFA